MTKPSNRTNRPLKPHEIRQRHGHHNVQHSGAQVTGKRKDGASQSKSEFKDRFNTYFSTHFDTAFESLDRLLRTPGSSLLTVFVLAIALLMPILLYVALQNVQAVTNGWETSNQLTLYLKIDTPETNAKALSRQLKERQDIADTLFVSRQQALEEFQEISGFGDVLKYLDDNPLPHVISVTPQANLKSLNDVRALVAEFENIKWVEHVDIDLEWVQRLSSLIDIGARTVWALSLVLGLSVVLVVGNTIRLAIESRRDEIIIIKLVGGTDSYVSRPFIYTGMWYGLASGLIAIVGLVSIVLWLSGPAERLAQAYQSPFKIEGLTLVDYLSFLGLSVILGLSGAFFSVQRHLRLIEPD